MTPLGRRGRLTIGATGAAAGLGASAALVWGGYQTPPELLAPTLVLNLAVGWSFIGVGLIAWSRRPDSRTGLLMVVLGFAWFARFIAAIATPAAFFIGVLLGTIYLSVFVHLLITFPTGRITTWAQRIMVTIGYLLSAPLDLVFLLAGAQRGLASGLPPNGLVIAPPARAAGQYTPAPVDLVIQAVVVAFFVTLLVIVFAQLRAATPVQRRSLAPAVWGAR